VQANVYLLVSSQPKTITRGSIRTIVKRKCLAVCRRGTRDVVCVSALHGVIEDGWSRERSTDGSVIRWIRHNTGIVGLKNWAGTRKCRNRLLPVELGDATSCFG